MAYVNGYAFAAAEEKEKHQEAWESVKHIKSAVISDSSHYAERRKTMDPEKIKGLSDLQKLVLADQGPSPFGGVVQGNRVTVYTD